MLNHSNKNFWHPVTETFWFVMEYMYFCLHETWKRLAHKSVTFCLKSRKWIISHELCSSFGQVHAPHACHSSWWASGILKAATNAGEGILQEHKLTRVLTVDLNLAIFTTSLVTCTPSATYKSTLITYYATYRCLVFIIWNGGIFQNKTSLWNYTI